MSIKSKGFTLIELMVTVAVALILGAIVLIGYGSIRDRLALDRSSLKLAQDIRRAQEMAMAQEAHGRYGIYFDINSPSSYVLFGDTNPPNKKYDSGEEIREIFLEDPVQIKSLAASSVNLVFEPPYPEISFLGEGEDLGDTIALVVSLKNNVEVERTITINKAGLIDVEN
jgi:prepilin-type N-terminal cleavage/methylation domain-containing protein